MGVHPVVTPIAQSHVRPTEPTLASSSSQMESRDALTSCPSSEHSLLESLTSRLSPSQGSVEQVQAREGPRTECPLGHAGEGVGRARGQRGGPSAGPGLTRHHPCRCSTAGHSWAPVPPPTPTQGPQSDLSRGAAQGRCPPHKAMGRGPLKKCSLHLERALPLCPTCRP